MNKDFSWVETHRQLVDYLMGMEDSQVELINLLESVGIGPFNDKSNSVTNEYDIKLDEIDPFTFFCYIYKYGSSKRLILLQAIAEKLKIAIPEGEKGIPSAEAQKVWLFPFKYNRLNSEIPKLWNFFKNLKDNKVSDSEFKSILQIKNVSKAKITEGLFYVNPENYLPLNTPLKSYIKDNLQIDTEFETFSDYIGILAKIKSRIDIPFYEFSFNAWNWYVNKKNMKNQTSFYEQLESFLKQAKTTDQTYIQYIKNYRGTKVKVGFGKGAPAKVPWFSFLKDPFTTMKGIYPGYLYYKEVDRLVLAYCISETENPGASWNLNNPITIREFFKENNLGEPWRYGGSFVCKVYDTNNLPGADVMDGDLNDLIDFYLNMETVKAPEAAFRDVKSGGVGSDDFKWETFFSDLEGAGLIFDRLLVTRFVGSLLTKPFAILTGLSGSGKTMLAHAFARWICLDKSQYCLVPVGADWTNREPLLGYPNALKQNEYVDPENGVLKMLINAGKNPHLPYFLILDEMNLSHVERYFADFLSVMESKGDISLHSYEVEIGGIPSKFKLPSNLFIIGTVNIDETTNMFSPKVLDRANTIEFRVNLDEMESFLDKIRDVNLDLLNGKGAAMAGDFLKISSNREFKSVNSEEINKELVKFFGELRKSGAEFGYRSATEILRLTNKLSVLDSTLGVSAMIDIAIMQKLLPKLHGSRRKLCPVLETLGGFCLLPGSSFLNDVIEKVDFDFKGANVKYSLSLEKIARMYRGAVENGFASFAEA